MDKVSYATARKIKIIEERVGANWREVHPEKSIDRVYSDVIGDTRKNLFCKIDSTVKGHLDEMRDHYDIDMAELIESLIQQEYTEFSKRTASYFTSLANQFALPA